MKISQFKQALSTASNLSFQLENGEQVPMHFHLTEVGIVSKDFIDCGGVRRYEKVANFQLWTSDDYDHRLGAEKALSIVQKAESILGMGDLEVEVEYQTSTIGKFGLAWSGEKFILTSKMTDCLAKENCGIPSEKPKVKLSEIQNQSQCTPGGGCC